MLALAYEHEHEFRRYVLRNVDFETVKEYTEMDVELIPDFFYIGYDCECSEQGFDT